MKNLFNNISQDEKNRILEMHSGKKNVMTEQSLGGAIDWAKDKINSAMGNSSFKVEATVEDDMVMEFPVVKFQYGGGGVIMFIKDYDGKILNVHSSGTEFKGPIFDTQSGKKKYSDSIFPNIDTKNWKTIAKQHNIPVSEVMREQHSMGSKHPTDSKLWVNMTNDINGDGVEIIKETPNQLVVNGVTGIWTITFKNSVMSEQSLGGAIDWAKDKINSAMGNSSFKAHATVEDDMVMDFPVVDIQYSKGSGVNMRIKDQTDGNKLLYVNNFEGPIFDVQSGKKKYRSSYFSNIDSKNWKTIAKQNNIPVSEVTV